MPVEEWGYPEFPQVLSYLWQHFINLNNSRQSGMGMNPISYSEIDAYCRLMKVSLSTFDVSAIKRLDVIALNASSTPKSTSIKKG
jgi:hypothetical protein